MDYVGLSINGWIVKEIQCKNLNNRKRVYLSCECKKCGRIKEIRADKRNKITKCICYDDSNYKNMNDTEIKISKLVDNEWEKIKGSNICESKEELRIIFFKDRIGMFYKINNNRPYSKENYIYGIYDDLKEYHRKNNVNKTLKRKTIINELKKNQHGIK